MHSPMLPILRILPVGGVFLAILLLILALKTPGERPLPPSMVAARGPLMDLKDHPEWRRVMIEAALRRADELTRLRDVPVTPARSAPAAEVAPAPVAPAPAIDIPVQAAAPAINEAPPAAAPQPAIAGLPATRNDTDPDADSITGSIDESPGATIPVEIGEASSFELPVVVPMPEERPPVLRTPERANPAHESSRKRKARAVRAKPQAPKTKPAAQTGLFEDLFGGTPGQRTSTIGSEAPPRTGSY
jgi:hypothetical protein